MNAFPELTLSEFRLIFLLLYRQFGVCIVNLVISDAAKDIFSDILRRKHDQSLMDERLIDTRYNTQRFKDQQFNTLV